jgi:hypothetical protein
MAIPSSIGLSIEVWLQDPFYEIRQWKQNHRLLYVEIRRNDL